MKKNLGLRLSVIIATLVIFVVGIVWGPPSNWSASSKALHQGRFKAALLNNIHLGLDLKGGTHLILQVQVDDAINAETDNTAEQLRAELQKEGASAAVVTKNPDRADRIIVTGVPAAQSGTFRDYVGSALGSEYDFNSGANGELYVDMKPSYASDIKKRAVEQAIETIRSRVDALGVSEPVIQEHGLGDYQILVQLPGVDDPAKVNEIIQTTARLEMKKGFGTAPYPTEAEALQAAQQLPGGLTDKMVLPGSSTGSAGNQGEQWYVVSRAAVVSGTDVRSATADTDQAGRPDVTFILTTRAGDKFGQFTGANVGQPLAAVLDNRVIEWATIQSQIRDQGNITGGFTQDTANTLAVKLNSGALPASMKQLEDRVVGASLGADSIRQGVTAAIVGMAAVLLFMLIYYRGAGINADLALFLNLVILLGFLGFSGATLTLPGIAGVILTIGMGVDSNVLIFERIREEARHGKAPAAAVDHGFAHAWLTIVDTHITTIVSALFLMIFGAGPVRGFAVTLAFGLFANLFTAVFVSRTIFDWLLSKKPAGEPLSI